MPAFDPAPPHVRHAFRLFSHSAQSTIVFSFLLPLHRGQITLGLPLHRLHFFFPEPLHIEH